MQKFQKQEANSSRLIQITDPLSLLQQDVNKLFESTQNITLSKSAQSYLLFELYRAHGEQEKAINQLEQLTKTEIALNSYLWQLLGDLYTEVGDYAKAIINYQTALKVAQTNNDGQAEAATYIYDGEVNLADYVCFLAEESAPQLLRKLQAIPDRFLERLAAHKDKYNLKQQLAPLTLGPGFEAMEHLAATYITTQILVETLSVSDIDQQCKAGQLSATLQDHAKNTAEKLVGIGPERATIFAKQYAGIIEQNLKPLQQLIEP